MKLSRRNKIKWQQKDYLALGKAVANFNKKINALQKEEKKLYLPDVKEYSEVKENITTRNELNRVINSLRRFNQKNAEELYKTNVGEELTRWEFQELGIQKRIATARLNRELKELNKPLSEGFSRAQMGSQRVREIKRQLESFEKLTSKKGYEFERIANRIKLLGTSDYTLKKAYIFRENFMEELKNLKKNSKEFKEIFDYFNNIKNPITFFNETQKSDALQDFFLWYLTPEAYASFSSKKDLGEYILNQYKESD